MGDGTAKSPLMERYDTEVASLTASHTAQCINSAAGVLYCCVMAVVDEGREETLSMGITDRDEAELAPLSHVFTADGKFIELPLEGSGFDTFKALIQAAVMKRQDCVRKDIIAVEGGDQYSQQLARWAITAEQLAGEARSNVAIGGTFAIGNDSPRKRDALMLHATIKGLQVFQQHAVIRRQISRLMAGDETTDDKHPLPLKPLMSATERGIQETELLSFTPLSPNDLYRNHRLQVFDTMLHSHAKDLPNFTGALQAGHGEEGAVLKRRYYRQLSAFTFAQLLASEEQKEPVVFKQYYQLTDNLLMVLHWPPPDRRCRRQHWEAAPPAPVSPLDRSVSQDIDSHQDSPVSQRSSVQASPAGSHASNPVKKQMRKKGRKRRGSADSADEEDAAVQQHRLYCAMDTVTMTPAGSAIAMIKRFSRQKEEERNDAPRRDAAWLTIYIDGDVLGLRCENEVAIEMGAARSSDSLDGAEAIGLASKSMNEAAQEVERSLSAEGASAKSSAGNKIVSSADEGDIEACLPSAAMTGVFFWHTADDVRFSAFSGPCPEPIRKPDGFGTCCLSATFPDGMLITLCSNGTIKFDSQSIAASCGDDYAVTVTGSAGYEQSNREPERTGDEAPDAPESFEGDGHEAKVVEGERELSRFISAGATVMRVLEPMAQYREYVPVRKEVLEADGTRTWILDEEVMNKAFRYLRRVEKEEQQRREQERLLKEQFGMEDDLSPADEMKEAVDDEFKIANFGDFHYEILLDAPEGCKSIQFGKDGSVMYYTQEQQPQQHSKLTTAVTMSTLIDGESKSKVLSYRDGRIVTEHSDGRREVCFPDGTVILSYPAEGLVVVSRHGLPTVEMDVEVDAVSREHAKGKEVPINKGGERVRARVALPDGSAALIKYDTKLTATTNGSLKLVRRDKSVLLVDDAGSAAFHPSSLWDEEAAQKFREECFDLPVPHSKPAHEEVATATVSKHQHHHAKFADSVELEEKPTVARKSARPVVGKGDKDTAALAAALAASPMGLTTNHRSRGRGSSNSPSPSRGTQQQTSLSSERPATSGISLRKDEEAKFAANFLHFTCTIMDREYNKFNILLSNKAESDALSPSVELSGEVAGLKPPAVTDKPMEPRLFIVHRSAEATEVLSTSAVSQLDALVTCCPEMNKLKTEAELPPADLGPATLCSYYQQRRLLGRYRDGFNFESIFGSRRWYSDQTRGHPSHAADKDSFARTPAAAHILLRRNPYLHELSAVAAGTLISAPRFFEYCSFVDQPPLSTAGHEQLKAAIKQCDDFRDARTKSIDRFAVEEDRSEEELQQVEALAKRLKLAYKAAKVNAAKRKEARDKARQQEAGNGADGADADAAGLGSPDLLKAGSTILEGNNEDEDADDGEGDGEFLEDEEPELDPVDQLLRECFDDFSIHQRSSGWSGGNDYEIVLPRSSLQDCLIQIFNCYISEDNIDFWLEQSEECEVGLEDFTFHEFRSLYKCIAEADNLGQLRHKAGASNILNYSTSQKSIASVRSAGYWESGEGKRTMSSLPSTAPPLDLRKLEWNADTDSAPSSPNHDLQHRAATVGGVYPYREQQNGNEARKHHSADPDDFTPAEFVSPFDSPFSGPAAGSAKVTFPAGSALQAARSAK